MGLTQRLTGRLVMPPPALVSPVALDTAETWGTPALTGANWITPVSIGSGQAFGTHSVFIVGFVVPEGLPSAEAWGTPELTSHVTVGLPSIPPGEEWGEVTVTRKPPSQHITVASLGTAEVFGHPTVTVHNWHYLRMHADPPVIRHRVGDPLVDVHTAGPPTSGTAVGEPRS